MMGILGEDEVLRLESLIEKAGLPTRMPDLELERVVGAIRHDKKIAAGKTKFVLPKSIGEVFISQDVAPSIIEKVLIGLK